MFKRHLVKCVSATIAAAVCVVFASGVRAVEINDDPNAYADSPTGVCHVAFRQCHKQPPAPVSGAQGVGATAATPLARGEFDHQPFGSACHPAYQPCAKWSL